MYVCMDVLHTTSSKFYLAIYLLCVVHVQGYELAQVTGSHRVEMVALLNLGATCELSDKLDKAVEWHTLVSHCTDHSWVHMQHVGGRRSECCHLMCDVHDLVYVMTHQTSWS